MFKELYSKIKKYIIKRHNYLLFIILSIIVLNIKLPYVVNAPGGVISLKDRVKVNGKNIDNNYYTSYVTVMNGKLASVIASFIMPNWDLEKYEEYSGSTNLTYDEITKAEKLAMKDGNNTAIILAFNKAGINYETINNKLVVYYKTDEYKNDLNIGDQIVKCENNIINTLDELKSCVLSSRKDVDLTIIRNNKEKEINVPTYYYTDHKVIGIYVLNDFDIKSDYKVEIKTDKSESGSSGGFMTALSLYDNLSNLNLAKDLKIGGTGTIDIDGNVGKISGIKYKLIGAYKNKIDIFFCPDENYKEAIKYKKKYNLKLKIIKVKTIDDAINYLNKLKK